MSGSSITSRTRTSSGGGRDGGTDRSPWVLEWREGEPATFRTSNGLVDASSIPLTSTLVDQAHYGSFPSSVQLSGFKVELPVVEYGPLSGDSMKATDADDRSGSRFGGSSERALHFQRKDRKAAPSMDPQMIHIAPGLQAVLRGSHETYEAIQDDFYIPCQCVVCRATLFVIQDAAYALCPRCLSIVPLEGEFINRTVSGIGMGFTIDDLMRWQLDLLKEEK